MANRVQEIALSEKQLGKKLKQCFVWNEICM